MRKCVFFEFIFCISFFSFAQKKLSNEVKQGLKLASKGFVENKGQITDQYHHYNREVKYLLTTSQGMNVQLKVNSFSYDAYITEQKETKHEKFPSKFEKASEVKSVVYKFHRVDISFPGANKSPQIITEGASSDFLIYYIDGVPDGIKVHHFKKIIYKHIYPDIDLVFEIKDANDKSGFEYYFIVYPKGDANKIRINYTGAKNFLHNNRILISTQYKKIQEQIPGSYLSENASFHAECPSAFPGDVSAISFFFPARVSKLLSS